jgi:hypothetical protein
MNVVMRLRTRALMCLLLGVSLVLPTHGVVAQTGVINEFGDISIDQLPIDEQRALDEVFQDQFGIQILADDENGTTTPDTTSATPGLVSCFDYYTFNSVQVLFSPTVRSTVNGVPIDFEGVIKNNNPYPIVNGMVYVKVFRHFDSLEKNPNGNPVVDQFVVARDITMAANSEQSITFAWNVPAWALDGTYEIATFFVTENKYNLLGLSFTDDIVGNTALFDVRSDIKNIVEFNKETVTVQGVRHLFAGFPNRVRNEEPVTIVATLENTTSQPVEIPITTHVYAWDAMHPDNHLETTTQIIRIPARGSAPVSVSVTHTGEPVYLVEIVSQYRDAQSILNVRFVREGVNKLRINFPSTNTYPLQADQPATVFTCVHNTADAGVAGELRLQVLDTFGTVLHTQEYKGMITGDMMALATTFTPPKTYTSFRVKAELFQKGSLITSEEVWYRCDVLNTCTEDEVMTWWDIMLTIFNTHKTLILSILGGVVLFFLAVVVYLWRSSKKVTSTMI